jgi:hypothetical protein
MFLRAEFGLRVNFSAGDVDHEIENGFAHLFDGGIAGNNWAGVYVIMSDIF